MNGMLTFHFNGFVIGNSIFIFNSAATGNQFTFHQHGLRHGCFPRFCSADECDISNFACFVNLHVLSVYSFINRFELSFIKALITIFYNVSTLKIFFPQN